MKIIFLLCLVVLSAYQLAPAQQPVLGPPGTVAVYALAEEPKNRPEFETENGLSVVRATIRLGPALKNADDTPLQWYGLEFTRRCGDSYQMWILLDSWPTESHAPVVAQYLWQEPGWPDALKFVHQVSGEALLPRLNLWTYGWPQHPERAIGGQRAPVQGTPDLISLQGWPFRRTSVEVGPLVVPPAESTELPLNPDLLNGWLAFDRDKAGRPHYRLGQTPDGQPKGYDYVAKTPEELRSYLTAGANFLVSHPGERARANYPNWLTRSSMFHNNLAYKPLDWPADLYRSNYWGFGNHVDEPGVHNWGLSLDDSEGAPLPEVQAVDHLQQIVLKGVKQRGQSAIHKSFAKNFGLGTMDLLEGPESIVVWEYEWPTAWYQLAVDDGVGGIVDEDATTNDLVEAYNMGLGTHIPPTVENAVAIRVAVLRGAARNFNKKWGIAFYQPSEVKLKSATIPLFYEKGASYFWYWTGWIGITDNSGLPYPYQIYYSSLVRDVFSRNPNRNHDQLLRAARVAVVIPYGYTFTPYHMHRIDWLHLERKNQHGVQYREVLANAALEVERMLRQGEAFDIVVDDPQATPTGYEELIFAQADGKLRIERPGRVPEFLDQPRPFDRPYLGPGPRLRIEVTKPEEGSSDPIRFRAVGNLGTGDWAGERSEPLVSWEVYGPDNRVRPSTFPEYGSHYSLKLDAAVTFTLEHPIPADLRERNNSDAPLAGSYTIRAALADVFGRPAIAYQTIYLKE